MKGVDILEKIDELKQKLLMETTHRDFEIIGTEIIGTDLIIFLIKKTQNMLKY